MFEEDRKNIEESRNLQSEAGEAPAEQAFSGQSQGSGENAYQQSTSYGGENAYQQSAPRSEEGAYQQSAPRSEGNAYQQNTPRSEGSAYQQGTPQSEGSAYQQSAPYSGENAYQQNPDGYYHRVNMSHIPEEPHREHHGKKRPIAAKVAGVTAAALLFGTVAGGTMLGVNTFGEYLKGQYASGQEQSETKTTVAVAETQGSDSKPAAADVTPALQMDVSGIVEKAMPSVVAINNTMVMEQQTWFGPTQQVEVPSSGSGIIVGQNDDELLIVTNNHVVQDSKELTVTFIDDKSVQAAIKGTDSESDLAVIAVPLSDIEADTMSQIKIATLGDSDSLKVGQGVVAIGNALGYGQSVTVGYVSALDREVKADDQTTRNLLQTDAAINPGNSGGALLNMKGEVIGINAAKYSSTSVEGMGYAIPISKAQDIINELMNKKTRVAVDEAKQGYLGIQGQNIDETAAAMYDMPRGIFVYKIMDDGAAAASDLREKDIITKFDGQTVRTMADLKEMLTYYAGGDTVDLTVQSLENGEYVERTVTITLGLRSEAETN